MPRCSSQFGVAAFLMVTAWGNLALYCTATLEARVDVSAAQDGFHRSRRGDACISTDVYLAQAGRHEVEVVDSLDVVEILALVTASFLEGIYLQVEEQVFIHVLKS